FRRTAGFFAQIRLSEYLYGTDRSEVTHEVSGFLVRAKKRRHRPPFYYIVWCLHVFDDFLRKFRTLQERGPFHQPEEIVGYAFRVACAFETFVDEVCCLLPTHVLEHHRPGKDHGTSVHLVLTGVLRSRSVSRFEDGVSRYVVNIRAGRNA